MAGNAELCLLITKKLEIFCLKNRRWPYNINILKNGTDRMARYLYKKLFQIGYLGELEFEDYTIRNEKGQLIIDVLDRLYGEYNKKMQIIFIARMILDIKRYCLSYNAWPETLKEPQTHQEIMANRCRCWLDKNGFVPGNKTSFNYQNLRDKSGKLVVEVLNDLYFEMHKDLASSEVLRKVEEVVNFCDEFHRWPTSGDNDGTLETWLLSAEGYQEHQDELYTKGIKIKDIIEHYRFTYGTLDVQNEGVALYQLIITKSHYMFKSFEAFNEFQEQVIAELQRNNLNISFQDIALEIVLPIKERVAVYQKRYEEFKNAGLSYLANFYYNLYLYWFLKDKVELAVQVRKRKN